MASGSISSDRKQKRKRTVTEPINDPSEPFTSAGSRINERHNTMKAHDKAEFTKTNDRLSGSNSKRVRRESSESSQSVASTKAKKNFHSRSLPTNRLAQTPSPAKSYTTRLASMKPPSVRPPASPGVEVDDSMSVADSIVSTGRIRRTETERKEYFMNEPECGALEDNRAECTRCGKFVALGRKQKYTVRPWEIHRARCDQKPPKSLSTGLVTDAGVLDEVGESFIKTKPATSLDMVEQRKLLLEADPYISAVKPHEVLCRICGSWVHLSAKQPYRDSNWKTHSLSCKEASTASFENYQPSTRVATATRKLQLVNDAQVKSFTARQITCGFCDKIIGLKGEGDYSITNWELHKETCNCPSNDAGTESCSAPRKPTSTQDISTIPFPSNVPPSSASISTDDTLIASELNQASRLHGAKRLREVDTISTLPCDPDARPSNRPRIDANKVPSEEENSSGWLMLPFKAFVRGFKESLKRS